MKVLSNKETVDRQNHGGFTALHLACQAGHNQSARELLLAGADPNLVNTYGDTALHTAVRYGHAGVARILLSARAGPDVQNKVNRYCIIYYTLIPVFFPLILSAMSYNSSCKHLHFFSQLVCLKTG